VDPDLVLRCQQGIIAGMSNDKLAELLGVDPSQVVEIRRDAESLVAEHGRLVMEKLDSLGPEHSRRPLSPETRARFAEVVDQVFVPTLKAAGYRKSRLRWSRPGDPVVTEVSIQRDSDLYRDTTRFTVNWDVLLTSGAAMSRSMGQRGVFMGRIGWFGNPPADRWWTVSADRFSKKWESVIEDPMGDDDAAALLVSHLDALLAFLDDARSPERLIEFIEENQQARGWAPYGASYVRDAAAVLSILTPYLDTSR